jgi:hypothetical protein
VLRKRSNEQIDTKLGLGYSKDALCHYTVDVWAGRFWSGRTSVEDDDRPGRLSRDDFSAIVPGHLERNPHISCHEISKDLFVLMTIISRILEEIGSGFFTAK